MTFNHQDYLEYLKSHSRKPRIKVELMYRTTEEVFDEITADIDSTSGSLSNTNQNGQRRSIGLTIIDPKRKYQIQPYGLWMDIMFRVYKGFEIEDKTEWILQGTFINYDPDIQANLSSRILTLNGLDKMALLNSNISGTLEATYQIPSGSYMKDAIIAILNEIGDTSPLMYDSVFEGYQVPYTITHNAGDTYYSILEELAKLRSSNVYYNECGSLCFTSGVEDLDDSLKYPEYFFNKNYEPNYINGKKAFSFSKVKNYCKVSGMTIDGQMFTGEASITDLSSPVSIQLIGKKTMTLTDENINSDQLCIDRANYELKNNSIVYLSVTISCLSIFHLDVNEVIEVTDEDLDFDQQRLLIQSITDSYSNDNLMTIQCSNINDITYTN